jgi:polyhydroxybutyrate depolymerase
MIIRLFVLMLLLLSEYAFGQSVAGTLMHNGISRSYRLYTPSAPAPSEGRALILNMHGFTSNAAQQEFYSGMNAVADTAGFFVVYPNGVGSAWNVGWTFGSTADDVGFLSALIDDLAGKHNIDLTRVYACGMSNGGFMAFRLACELNDRIAAVASVTGSMVQEAIDVCNPQRPVPVLQIHGTADNVVNINGTPGVSIAVGEVLRFWQTNNGCDSEPTIAPMPNTDANDNTTSERWVYNDCENSGELMHIRVTNGGHTWPGAALNTGVTSRDFSANVEIWNFFRRHQLPMNTSADDSLPSSIILGISPNPSTSFVDIHIAADAQLMVYNSWGKLVVRQPLSSSSTTLDIASWTSGIYFLHIRDEGGNTAIKKLIKI